MDGVTVSSSVGVQKVVVIQDASREVSWSAIRYVMTNKQLLKPGDELILIPVLHQVNNPMGYKHKVDSSSMFGSNSKMVAEEVSRMDEQYRNNADMKQISMQCEMQKIKLVLKVYAGNSPRVVAIQAALDFEATWVILDRQMKKDKKYFMEKLSCGISRMKRDNTVEKLRRPRTIDNTVSMVDKSNSGYMGDRSNSGYVSYGEMIPGSPNNDLSPQKSPSSQEPFSRRKQRIGDIFKAPLPDLNKSDQLSKSLYSTDPTIWSSSMSSSTSTSNTEASSSSFTDFHTDQKDHKHIGKELEKEQKFQNSICSVCKNRRPKAGWKRDFRYAELHEATNGFSDKNFLSEGGFGCVYRGKLKNGLKLAVKQHKDTSFQGEKQFKSEVYVLSKARHQNLVMLLGSCSEGSHRLLVYEYVCYGSLDLHLSKHTKRPLNWSKRIKIALGAAEGLEFLHKNKIIHRDLGDFGLARNQYEEFENPSESSVVGTLGYLAPEYAECGKATTKSDVYSFGVVLLQLITGLRTTDKALGSKSLVGWARPLLQEKNYPNLIDTRIGDSFDVHQLFWMVRLADKCLNLDPSKRYTMTRVVNALHYIMEGNTSFIKDFSPTLSDSVNSGATDSTPSQDGSRTKDANRYNEEGIISKIDDVSASSETVVSVADIHYEESEAAGVDRSGVLYNEMII